MALEKEVKVFRSVDMIGRDAINSIASSDAFFTYEWFKILETQRSFRISPFYLAVYDEDRLIAFTPCFVDWKDIYFNVGPRLRFINPLLQKMMNFGGKHGFCREHVLLCYSPSCGRSKVLQTRNPEQKMVLDLLAEKIDDICKKEKFLFSSFHFVSEFDDLLIEGLKDSRYFKSSGITNFYLNVRWNTFEDYLKSLKGSHRHNALKKIRCSRESGVSIEEQEFKSFSATKLAELLQNLNLKYDKNAENIIGPGFYDKVKELAAEKIKLFVAKKNRDVVGFSLLFRQGDTVDFWMCGFNYDALTERDYVYFNVAYAVIQWAIDAGIKKIFFRATAERAKLGWGCKPEETLSFVKCHDTLLGPVINTALRAPFWSYLSR
jgi:predicted N-acyltransferase